MIVPLASGLLIAALSGNAISGVTRHRSDAEAAELARPAPEERVASSARAVRDLGPLRRQIEHTSFWLLGSSHPIQANFVGREDDFSVSLQDPNVYAGLATAITPDGYMMTAAHMIRPYMCVIGWSEGRQSMASARVVYVATDRHAGAEYAMIKAEGLHPEPMAWDAPGSVRQKLYASAGEQKQNFRRIELEGELTAREGSAVTGIGRVVATDIPFYRGDSGGGVFNSDGHFIGVIICFYVPWNTEVVSRLIFAPDRRTVMSRIEADRQRVPVMTGPAFDETQTVTLSAGQRVVLARGQTAKVPYGTTVVQPGPNGSGVVLAGQKNTVEASAGVIVTVPADASGPADNVVVAR